MQFRRMYDSILFVLINIAVFIYCDPATNEIGGMDSNDYDGLWVCSMNFMNSGMRLTE